MAFESSASRSLLRGKLQPPQIPTGYLDRSGILQRPEVANARVAVIVAPAGFGKTTVLAQAIRTRDDSVGWLTVDREDNALSRFLEYVIGAIESFDLELADCIRRRAMPGYEPGVSAVQQALLYEIANYSVPWTFVIDDFHVLTDPDVLGFVSRFIDALPADCRLLIASRTEPALPTARLRVHGDLALLNAADLRARPADAQLLFSRHGVDISKAQAVVALERSGGWMLGLHLIARAAQARSIEEVLGTLSTLAENVDLVGEYLLQEVLDQQEPELRAFLLDISILDRFTADTCYVVAQQPATRLLLDQIRRRGLFLIDLDEAETWHGFHHVFRDFLRRRFLTEASPQVIQSRYAAASRWHAERGLMNEAITFAIAAHQWETAATLIIAAASDLIFKHRLPELFTWISAMPADAVMANPNLCTIIAYGLIRDGRGVEAIPLLDAAERAWQAEGFTNGLAMVEMNRAMAARFRGAWPRLVSHAARAIELVPGEQVLDANGRLTEIHPQMFMLDGTWRNKAPQSTSYLHLALGLLLLGRVNEAEPVVLGLQSAWAEQGYDLTMNVNSAVISMLRLAKGELESAETIARRFAEPDPDDRPTERALNVAVLAEVLYEWNRLDEAEQVLLDGLRMLDAISAIGASESLHILLARVLWAKQDPAGAYRALDAAAGVATTLQNLTYAHEAEAQRVQFAVASGDRVQALQWAKQRELSVNGDLAGATMFEWLTYARVLIATDDAAPALQLLERLRESAGAEGDRHHHIKALVLEGLAYLDIFQLDQAAGAVSEALALAEDGHYLRVFIAEGSPMIRLLRIAHRRGASIQLIRDLLEAVGETPEEIVRIDHQGLIEPVTPREIQVLRLIALGLTNKEIGEELFLTVGTVKRHVTNLYGKLEVSNRTEAVQRARKLRLLAPTPPTEPIRASTPPE